MILSKLAVDLSVYFFKSKLFIEVEFSRQKNNLLKTKEKKQALLMSDLSLPPQKKELFFSLFLGTQGNPRIILR